MSSTSQHNPINIRNVSIKCGHCDTYQTLSAYERRDDWNVYTRAGAAGGSTPGPRERQW